MTEGFDKEIDALLRQTAQGETAFAEDNPKSKTQNSKSPHLAADEISLFAENALPKHLRQTAIAHFADCDRCRKILANLIEENTKEEIVSAAPIELFPAPIPWYRKLFAFPNLAYTLGALVIAFSGLIAFTVLQSVKNTQNMEVSQVSERQLNGKGAASDGEATIVEAPNANLIISSSTANASMSNATMMSNAALSKNTLNSAARNSDVNSVSNSSADAPTALAKPPAPVANSTADSVQTDGITSSQISELPLNSRAFNNSMQSPEAKKKKVANAAENDDSTAAPTTESKKSESSENEVVTTDKPAAKARISDLSSATAGKRNDEKAKSETVETRRVSGKTFARKNNVWIDSAYKNQPTINVARGTESFIRLDAGLRSIAENLGGTIIIVWKDKAYRIQ